MAGISSLRLSADLLRLDTLWREGLERFGGGFLADGRFTAADAFYTPVVLRLYCYGLDSRLSTPSKEYVDQILGHDYVRQWCGENF